MARRGESARWRVQIGATAAIVLALVGLSIVAVMAARGARDSAAEVRTSTSVWNAYQQARYSVLQEALLTQDFRLAGSPEYEQAFDVAAGRLAEALATVQQTGTGADRNTVV